MYKQQPLGYKCIVLYAGIVCNAKSSLFTYKSGESWATYYDPYFIPSYQPTFSSPELQSEAEEICGDDALCLFDIAATGIVAVGISTLETSQELEEIYISILPGKIRVIR